MHNDWRGIAVPYALSSSLFSQTKKFANQEVCTKSVPADDAAHSWDVCSLRWAERHLIDPKCPELAHSKQCHQENLQRHSKPAGHAIADSMPTAPLSYRAYCALSFLAVFFTFWTLIFPATYLVGWLPGYKPSPPKFVAADPQAIVKFAAWPSIKIIHGLAGCLWTGLLPFQLHHGMRKRWPNTHRITGRVMMAGGVCVVIGYAIMELGHVKVIQDHGIHKWTFYRTLVCWFVYTACRSISAAKRGDIEQHSRWAVRHAAPGLTFAAGRLMVLLLGFVCHYLHIADMTQLDNKMAGYYVSIYTAAACCLGGAELALRRKHTVQQQAMQPSAKPKRHRVGAHMIGRKVLSHATTWLFTQ